MPFDQERAETVTPVAVHRNNKRARLHAENPRCYWCDVVTVLEIVTPHNPTTATIDHLYSKLHPERNVAVNVHKIVLACHECNNERHVCETKRRPFVPKLAHRRAEAEKYDATLAPEPKREAHSTLLVIRTIEDAVRFARQEPQTATVRTLREEYEQEVLTPRQRRKRMLAAQASPD
jgi:hypothetical protein